MKLMMAISAGGCFLGALALGYLQGNTLPTTLLRAVIAMLIGLFLARWWGLLLRRQVSLVMIEEANNEKSLSTDKPGTEGNEQTGNPPETEGAA